VIHIAHGRRTVETVRLVAPQLDAEAEACALTAAKLRLRATGLPEPRVLICAEDVTRGKPDPEGYLAAAHRLGVEPDDCIVVEDAPAGLAAASAAGMRSVGVVGTYPMGALTDATHIVGSLPELRITDRHRSERLTVQLTLA
jgi:mannitol-1-/sugar-/sorbitol-6-phosphatase